MKKYVCVFGLFINFWKRSGGYLPSLSLSEFMFHCYTMNAVVVHQCEQILFDIYICVCLVWFVIVFQS